ncbi:hypothetical protein AVEN_141985-1 [Araneus ventricosus]|uniref:Uncharacterized protein n=1 Tax=Araneus ventricosus TaxID=182803 RepID=A0A4Y2KGD0_ARAVE|nr:hypothetical protein AVEN_141985-1 [Araneus ventricosus]
MVRSLGDSITVFIRRSDPGHFLGGRKSMLCNEFLGLREGPEEALSVMKDIPLVIAVKDIPSHHKTGLRYKTEKCGVKDK